MEHIQSTKRIDSKVHIDESQHESTKSLQTKNSDIDKKSNMFKKLSQPSIVYVQSETNESNKAITKNSMEKKSLNKSELDHEVLSKVSNDHNLDQNSRKNLSQKSDKIKQASVLQDSILDKNDFSQLKSIKSLSNIDDAFTKSGKSTIRVSSEKNLSITATPLEKMDHVESNKNISQHGSKSSINSNKNPQESVDLNLSEDKTENISKEE